MSVTQNRASEGVKKCVCYFLFHLVKSHISFSMRLMILSVHSKKTLQNRDQSFPSAASFASPAVTRAQHVRLWKSKLTPCSLPPARVHVLLRGLCGGKVRPLWPSSSLICPLKISFLSFHGRVRADQNPPSVIRNGWCGWSKPPIRHADRMVWVNGPGIRERRGRSVTPKTDKTPVERRDEHRCSGRRIRRGR